MDLLGVPRSVGMQPRIVTFPCDPAATIRPRIAPREADPAASHADISIEGDIG